MSREQGAGSGKNTPEKLMRRKFFGLTLSTMLFALCFPVEAQQQKIPRIGYLAGSGDPNNPGPEVVAFRQGLRDLGYIEGKNILVEYRYRYAEGKQDHIPSFVAELVQLKVDVLISPLGPAIIAAKQATKTIPIVVVLCSGSSRDWANR
jgi:putative ABC transport system substrate-binding protein